jgi:cytochrome c556
MTVNLQQLFPEGTAKGDGPDTTAAPAIWEKWGEFEQVAAKFEQESAKLMEVADSGDMAALGQQLGALGKEACGSCHETFRIKN